MSMVKISLLMMGGPYKETTKLNQLTKRAFSMKKIIEIVEFEI